MCVCVCMCLALGVFIYLFYKNTVFQTHAHAHRSFIKSISLSYSVVWCRLWAQFGIIARLRECVRVRATIRTFYFILLTIPLNST